MKSSFFPARVLLLFVLCAIQFSAKAQIDFQVGNGTSSNTQYSVPTPFIDYYDNSRSQFLFRASELTSAGMFPGAILAIKWKVESLNSQSPIPGYRVFIGTTSQNDLGSGWVNNVNNQVFTATGTYTANPGVHTFNLATPLNWNGTDNIVIQVCHGNTTRCYTYTRNASVNYTATGFTSSRVLQRDCVTTNLCTSTSGYLQTSTNRPNTTFSMGLPCNDTPKTSVRGPKQVCPNRPFTISPADYYAGAEYSWEYSTNGLTWSNYTGIPSLSGAIKDSITATKWYRLTVKCKANNNFIFTTAPHKVEIAPFYYCYCLNEAASDTGANLGNLTVINSNQLDTVLDKSKLVTGTGLPVYNNDEANKTYTGYHDSLSWPCLYRDTNYIYHISQIHQDGKYLNTVLQAYVDYNRDGVYDPNNERLFVHALDGTGNPKEVIKTSATVPSNAKTGPTGLRLILSDDTIKGGPCGTYSGAGEVEDYIVEICYRPCDSPVNPGLIVSTDTSMCAGYEYTVTDTTYDKTVSGFSTAWQISGDNVTWFNITNSTDKDTLQRVFGGQPLYYRYRTICLPTHDTNYSQPTLINDKPGYKCYCYSKAIGGLGVDSSDIGGVTIANYTSNAGGPHLLNAKAVKPRTDFTDINPVELYIDSLYKFELFHTMPVPEHGDAKITVFMDFNNNHEYDIPSERIYTGYTTIGNHTLVDNVIIPQNAITDVPTGMRVIVNNDVGPNIPSDEACGAYQSGETEDYVLIFRKPWKTSVGNVGRLTGFNVHPNPTTGRFYVQFSTNADIDAVNVRVTNVTGQVIHQQAFGYEGGMFSRELDMTGQPAGVYFVELQADGQSLMQKLVVQ